jgi:hypothetical protein
VLVDAQPRSITGGSREKVVAPQCGAVTFCDLLPRSWTRQVFYMNLLFSYKARVIERGADIATKFLDCRSQRRLSVSFLPPPGKLVGQAPNLAAKR